jgi:hypothetical protein
MVKQVRAGGKKGRDRCATGPFRTVRLVFLVARIFALEVGSGQGRLSRGEDTLDLDLLRHTSRQGVPTVELDNEKKAAMVSNLLVVLCSKRGTQPIVSAGKSG